MLTDLLILDGPLVFFKAVYESSSIKRIEQLDHPPKRSSYKSSYWTGRGPNWPPSTGPQKDHAKSCFQSSLYFSGSVEELI